MKISKKILVIIICAVLAVGAALTVILVVTGNKGGSDITVKFQTNGGNEIADVILKGETQYELPVPVKANNSFEGWYTSEDLSGAGVKGTVNITENVTYYAKWAQLYNLTFDAAGGNMSAPATVQAKAGANLADVISRAQPALAHHEFEGWYNGTQKLTSSFTMPAKDTTVIAKYKVEYRVELYLQTGKDSTEYLKSEEDFIGYEFAGKTLTANVKQTGYDSVSHSDEVTEITLSDDYSQNVLKQYFDIKSFRVIFYSNYPAGSGKVEGSEEHWIDFGDKMNAPYGIFSLEGYILAGWAESTDGAPIYKVDYIRSRVQNAVGEEVIADEITLEANAYLYAVWSKGLYDMFGGNDVMYYNDPSSDAIYLERGGLFFKGTYIVRNNYFHFDDLGGDIRIEGKLVDAFGNDITPETVSTDRAAFAIKNSERNNRTYNLYKVGSGVNGTTQVIFDAYNGITYSRRLQTASSGKYYIDEEGYYVVTYTEGPLAEEDNPVMTIKINESEDGTSTFQVRNEKEYAMGTIGRGIIYNGNLYVIKTEYGYGITMDGFGNAKYDNVEAVIDFTYSETGTDNEYKLLVDGNEIGLIRFGETATGMKYYMFYEEEFNHVYNIGDDATLIVDGFNRVTYTRGEETIEAFYTIEDSVFGGQIVSFKDSEGKEYKFIIRAETDDDVLNENGQAQVNYVAEEREANYAEYYFMDAGDIYYGPLVVMNGVKEEGVTLAEIWMRTASNSYVKVSDGEVTDKDERMVYTETEKHSSEDAIKIPVDFDKIKAFEFDVDSTSSNNRSFNVNYWYNLTTVENETYSNEVVFTSGVEKLTLVRSLNPDKQALTFSKKGIYFNGSNTYKGEYVFNTDGSLTFTYTKRIETENGTDTQEEKYYFRLPVEDGVYTYELIRLETTPYNAAVMKNGDYLNWQIRFDGSPDKATLYIFNEEDGTVENTYEGTITEKGQTTVYGSESKKIYTFKYADSEESFDYIVYNEFEGSFKVIYTSGYEVMYSEKDKAISLYSEDYHGDYYSDNGTLRIDGFGGWAKYTGAMGNIEGTYTVKDGFLTITGDSGYRYFDIEGEDSFKARGTEYGTYILRDNGYSKDTFYDLDGYGNLKVYIATVDDKGHINKENDIDENGSYEFNAEDKTVVFNYTAKGIAVEERGILGTYRDGLYLRRSFTPYFGVAAGIYLDPSNWSVLILDDLGNGVWYDEKGDKGSGKYTLITEKLLYFADENGEDGKIYNYDTEKKTISAVQFRRAHAYYTSDFNALVFSKAGFVVYNGEKNNYYTIVKDEYGNDTVIIFKHTGTGTYGFEEDKSFGTFDNEKDYLGEHFYQSEGLSIDFARDPERTENYRMRLGDDLYVIGDISFTPPGTKNFTNVIGDISVEGLGSGTTQCFISREDGKMYVTFLLEDDKGNLGSYDIYINATYRGAEGSTYYITGMERSQTVYSAQYLTYYYLYYYYFGAAAAQSYRNGFGTIKIVEVLNEDCEVEESYAEGVFGDYSAFKDYNGNDLGFKAPYEVEENVQGSRNDLYTVRYVAEDGFTYNVYFIVFQHPYMRALAYEVSYFGREETLTTENEVYEVTIERVAASDRGYKPGTLAKVDIKKNGERVENGSIAIINGEVYVIARNDDGSATYYKVDIKLETLPATEKDKVLKIESVEVTEHVSVTYFSDEKFTVDDKEEASFIDFVEGEPMALSVVSEVDGKVTRRNYIILSYEHDAETGVYTVTTAGGDYIVTIVEGKAVIEAVVEEPDEEGKTDEGETGNDEENGNGEE